MCVCVSAVDMGEKTKMDEVDLEVGLMVEELEKPTGGVLDPSLYDVDVAGAHVKLHVNILRTFFLFCILQYAGYTFAVYFLFSSGILRLIPQWIVSDLQHESHQASNSVHWLAERDAAIVLLITFVVTFLFVYTLLWGNRRHGHGWLRWVLLGVFMLGKIACLGLVALILDDLAPVQVMMNLCIISMALLGYALSSHSNNGHVITTYGALLVVGIMTLATWVMGLYAYIVQRHVALAMLIPVATLLGGLGLVYMVALAETARYRLDEKPLFYLDFHLFVINRLTTRIRPKTESDPLVSE